MILPAMVWLFATCVFVGCGVVVAVTIRRVFFPDWTGAPAVTVVALVWLAWALVIGQVLGAVGLLRPLPLVVAALVTALVAAVGHRVAARRRPDLSDERADQPLADQPLADQPLTDHVADPATSPPSERRPADPAGWEDVALTVGTVVLVSFVAAIWVARTVIALRRGILDPDSLGYHLPMAVTFAHSGYANQHRLLIPGYPIQFYPSNDELLSALALLLTRSVAFAAVKNLLFGALVVLASYAIGRAFGAARLAVAAAAVMLGFPVIAYSQPGAAVNDTLMLAALIGGLAVLAHARDRPAPYVLTLACAGLAAGVKFSALVPALVLAALAVVLLVARVPRHRVGALAAGLVSATAVGGSWYARNAITYGNPVPPVHVAFGPFHLRSIASSVALTAYSVAHYLLRGRFVGAFGHAVIRAIGPVGTVMVVLSLVAAAAGLRSPDGFRRGLSLFCLISVVGYLVTPAGAAGTAPQVPYAITVNLHYAAPALLAGLLAGSLAAAHLRRAWLLPVIGILAVLTSFGPGRSIAVWFPETGGFGLRLFAVAALAAGAVALARRRPGLRRLIAPALAVAVLAVVVGVVSIAGHFRSRRATDPVAQWAARATPTTIGAWMANIGDLYGSHARNQVTVLGRLVDGAAEPIVTCTGWKTAVVAGNYRYVAAIAGSAYAHWLRADPAFVIVAHDAGATVFQVVGPPEQQCVGQVNQA